jgi:hypothetical protein
MNDVDALADVRQLKFMRGDYVEDAGIPNNLRELMEWLNDELAYSIIRRPQTVHNKSCTGSVHKLLSHLI